MENISSLKEAKSKGWKIYRIILADKQLFALAAKNLTNRNVEVYKLDFERGNGGRIIKKENLGYTLFGYKNDADGMFRFLEREYTLREVRDITNSSYYE